VDLSPLLQISGVRKAFGGVIALDGVDLSLPACSTTCIIGPNGCGKTTLFNIISGAFSPTVGKIWFRGEELTGLAPHRIARKGIARKFQVPGIYPSLSVAENLEVPLISGSAVHPLRRLLTYGARDRRLTELLHLAQLDDKASIAACELSHGEKQWLEIAMLLASDAELLLLDEPTAGMTIAETARTADLIKNICFETGKTILAIEHDMHFVRRLDCHVVVMMRGRIFREGRYEGLQADPAVRTAYLGEVETC